MDKLSTLTYRPANWPDLITVVNLRNTAARSTSGGDITADHLQKRHWYESGINLETDSLLVFVGETPVAYAEVSSESPFVIYELTAAVLPEFRRRGIGSRLLDWAEARVLATVNSAPEGAAVFMQSALFDSNQPARVLLAKRGFAPVREFVYLEIHITERPPGPALPEGLEIRTLQPADWAKVGPALEEAFHDHWGVIAYDDPAAEVEQDEEPNPREADPDAFDAAYFNSPGLCFVAWSGDEVAGSCLCNANTVEFPGAGYLGSLSIRRPWRRRGIGRALTLHALNAFYDRGTTHVLTDTDAEGFTGAWRLYQNAGMEIFRREGVYEKTIRPGRDLIVRSRPAASSGH